MHTYVRRRCHEHRHRHGHSETYIYINIYIYTHTHTLLSLSLSVRLSLSLSLSFFFLSFSFSPPSLPPCLPPSLPHAFPDNQSRSRHPYSWGSVLSPFCQRRLLVYRKPLPTSHSHEMPRASTNPGGLQSSAGHSSSNPTALGGCPCYSLRPRFRPGCRTCLSRVICLLASLSRATG